MYQSDSGEELGYSLSVVQWPRSRVLSVSFIENLPFSDNISLNIEISLTESLDFTSDIDSVTEVSVNLIESISFNDDIIKDIPISLTETLPFTAIINKDVAVDLTETLPLDATLVKDIAVDLVESLPFNIIIDETKFILVSFTESLSFDDEVTKRGAITLEIKSSSTSFESDSIFRITPSPTNGTDSFTVTDGSAGDNDLANNGVIKITSAQFGDYLVEMLTPPTSFVVTTNKTSLSISATANPSVLFSVFSDSIAVENSDLLPATTSSILNSTSLNTLESFSTAIINQTSVAIDSSEDLPEMFTIGSNNTSDLDAAIAKQVNILIKTTTSSGITGSEFFDLIDMPTHALPSNANLTAIIAPIVTSESTGSDSGSSSTRQLVCSAPYEKVIPGQNMIMTVNSTLIKSFGGVSQFNVTSSPNATSGGTFTNDYTCIESADQLISAPTLASSGIDNVVELFFDVTYRNLTSSTGGFDWHDPDNLKHEGRTTVLIPKPTASNAITLDNGCADIEIHTLSDDGNTWGSFVDTIVSNIPFADNSNFCEVEIDSKHFSKKAVSSKRSSSPGSPSSGGDGSTGSSAGTSTGRGGAGGTTSFVGIKGSPLAINEISYDKCNDNMARILVSSDADVPPTVKVSTAKSGVVYGTLAEVQPYEDLNKFSTVDRYLYEVPITSEESFMMVTVSEEIGDNTNVVRASVDCYLVKELL